MKCPKCGYLGFEHVERCRNCGYDFSLSPPPNLPELRIRRGEPDEGSPVDDLALMDAVPLATPEPARQPGTTWADRTARATWSSHTEARGELPLFAAPPDDVPLIVKASPPRTPLAVRRATPEVPKLRADHPRTPALDPAPDSDNGQTAFSPGARAHRVARPDGDPHVEPEPAALWARLAAVAIDLIILAAIDALVVYFTVQICGLTAGDLDILPKAPLLAFLLVQNGGYLVAFTAGGQTLGKMAAGIKVVPTHADASLDLGRSLLRTLVWAALAVPAGLGFLTALFAHDRRGLHDLCAGTRVVRVSTS